jgi:hypothetical protein
MNDKMAERVAATFVARQDRLMTADEMERYCPDCAGQIRRGELEVTWGELRDLLAEDAVAKSKKASDYVDLSDRKNRHIWNDVYDDMANALMKAGDYPRTSTVNRIVKNLAKKYNVHLDEMWENYHQISSELYPHLD